MYNMSFQYAAIAIMVIILHQFWEQKVLNTVNARFFRSFLALGMLDVVFDILCTPLIQLDGEISALTKLFLTFFYLLQVLVPYILVAYEQTLREIPQERIHRIVKLWAVLPAIMGTLVLANYHYGMMFYFDAEGVYHEGPWYMLMYIYAIATAGIVGISSIIHYRELGLKKMKTIWEFLLLEAVCTGIQAYDGTQLMTAFGLGLGVMILYLTLNNPESYLDNLTGLYDARFFREWLGEEIYRKTSIHLLAIDVYQLKQVNQIYGSSVGDSLLVQVAGILRKISGSYKIFRISGNRFVLILDTLDEYEKNRESLRQVFEGTFEADGERIPFPAVICGIMNAEKMGQVDTLHSYIEYLASLAKGAEETVLIQSDPRILDGFHYEQEVEHYLKTAIEQNLFEVYYQPVYDLRKKRFITLEALSRLWHPTLGMIPPDVIFGIAERTGEISEIGSLQFARICRFLKENKWIMEKIQNVKFNMSPSELLKPDYCDQLIGIIKENGLEPSYFQFEVTETVATEYSEILNRVVKKLQNAGIGLCLDDFGSGYANLDTVLRLPFSAVKMDRSLLSGICTDEQSAVFYQSIVLMMQHMGYKVISEGVEKAEEVRLLEEWGVDMIQGFYFAKPMPEDKLKEVLAK